MVRKLPVITQFLDRIDYQKDHQFAEELNLINITFSLSLFYLTNIEVQPNNETNSYHVTFKVVLLLNNTDLILSNTNNKLTKLIVTIIMKYYWKWLAVGNLRLDQ